MRAHHIRLVAIVFFLASIISSCSESTSPSAPTEIIHLKEGNRWVYSISEYDSAHTLRWTFLDTIEIGAPILHNGKTWYPHLSITFRQITPGDTLFYTNENDGLWEQMFIRSLDSKPYLVYKYPATVGDTFAVHTGNFPDTSTVQRYLTKVGALQDIITVPAGTFVCIRYDKHLQILNTANIAVLKDDLYEQNYVAPGIGLIKSIQYYKRTTGPADSMKLSRYTQETALISYKF